MTKKSKIYKETHFYGLIPDAGNFSALVQIHKDFDYNSSLPTQLLNECCIKEFGVLPKNVSPISFEEHYDLYNNKINIVINKNKGPHCVVRQKQLVKEFHLTSLR